MNKTQLDKTLGTIKNYVNGNYLAKAGGTMTGDIKFNKNSRTGTIFNIFGGNETGHGVNFGGNGMTIVSAGESGNALVTEESLDGTQEHLMLTADQSIKFYTNCNTIGNRKSAILSNNLYFYPSTTGTGSVGTTNNKWNSMYANTFYGALSGNAGTATKLQNARKLGAANFDGTGNVPVTSMLGLNSTKSSGSGFKNKFTKIASINVNGAWSTCSGKLFFTSGESDSINGILNFYFRSNGDNNATSIGLRWETLTNSSYADSIRAVKTSTGKYDLYYMPKGDYEILKFYAIASEIDKMTLYTNQNYVNSITAAATSTLSAVSGSTTGNAGSATKLKTARSINGTNFDGTGNITTANWGTARTITIGGKGKSVNGSANVSWTLDEIGAAPKSHGTHVSYGGNGSAKTVSRSDHSHNYLPLSGGTLSGKVSDSRITTGNTQLFNAAASQIYIGNPGTPLMLESSNNPTVNKAGTTYTLYHTGNKPSLSDIGAAASSHTHNYITSKDTRAVNEKPDNVQQGLSIHLKSTGADGLSDGGSYHPSIHIKPWNDHSGGPYGELALTQNQNLWFRTSSSGTAWNAWKKVSLDGHTHNYAASSHNHTSLTGITSLTFASESTDRASIGTAISGTATYMDFKLADDAGNDAWRWRFAPSGGSEFNAMYLSATSATAAQLSVTGNIKGTGNILGSSLTASGNSKTATMGTGDSDVYFTNSKSGKYLQLKDDGRLTYSDKRVVIMENYDYNHKIRGGSGLSGADGYITFSW